MKTTPADREVSNNGGMLDLTRADTLTLRQLRYFVAVATEKSYSKASRALFVSQPTLSVAMQKLAAHLDTTLFETGDGLELTDTGRILFDEAVRILTAVRDVEQTIRTHGKPTSVRLKVGLTHVFTMRYMPQIVEYINENPGVEVTFVQGGSRGLQQRLAEGELDVAIVSHPDVHPDVQICVLGDEDFRLCAVVRPDHRLAGCQAVQWAQLEGEPLSFLTKDYVLRDVLEYEAAQAGFVPDVVFTNDNDVVLLESVAQLGSVSVLPEQCRLRAPESELKWVPFKGSNSSFQVALAWRRGEVSQEVDAFCKTILRGY